MGAPIIKPTMGFQKPPKANPNQSEADAGSMAGYDPNMGMKPSQVPNSGFTPKTGPLAPKAPAPAAPAKTPKITPRPIGNMQNANSTKPTASRSSVKVNGKGNIVSQGGRPRATRGTSTGHMIIRNGSK